MSSNEPWTIERLLRWTTDFLKQKGSESPRLDAEVLLAHARDCQRIDLYAAFTKLVSGPPLDTFRELVRQRAAGTPVAYLVGYREFYSLRFRVSPAVLIPRPETETLVLELLELAKQIESPVTVADVGTGSGIIAICAATYLPQAQIWATDISQEALAVASDNCHEHAVSDRIHLLHGDLLEPIPLDQTFHFIVSNPPYVSQAEFDALPADIRAHEPRHAIVAGLTGVEVIERLVLQAAKCLRPDGWLLIEISPMIESHGRKVIADEGHFHPPETIADLAGRPRILRAQRCET